MSRVVTLCAALSLGTSLLLAVVPAALAADEDTGSSVYLVFDPETGEFKTAHDPSLTQAAQADAEAIASVADVPPELASDGGGATAADTDTGADTETARATWVTLAVVIALLVLGVLAWRRRQAR